jgi:hypothetical protein
MPFQLKYDGKEKGDRMFDALTLIISELSSFSSYPRQDPTHMGPVSQLDQYLISTSFIKTILTRRHDLVSLNLNYLSYRVDAC